MSVSGIHLSMSAPSTVHLHHWLCCLTHKEFGELLEGRDWLLPLLNDQCVAFSTSLYHQNLAPGLAQTQCYIVGGGGWEDCWVNEWNDGMDEWMLHFIIVLLHQQKMIINLPCALRCWFEQVNLLMLWDLKWVAWPHRSFLSLNFLVLQLIERNQSPTDWQFWQLLFSRCQV